MSAMIKALTLAASLALLASAALADPTHVMVRAKAQDAKFIGDHMGGVQITLTDVRTGAVLAKGLTKGGTGDTPRIMKTPRTRGMSLADPSAAGFEAILDLKQPTLVRVDAVGPVGKPRAAIKVSSTQWILPGHDIVGDGWVLDFPGLVIEPSATFASDGALQINAKVSLMCGCPIEPGGIWNADTYRVEARLMKGDREVASTALTYAGQASQFWGTLPNPPLGRYRLRLIGSDETTSNTGVMEISVRVR
jgi:hypothetical protein